MCCLSIWILNRPTQLNTLSLQANGQLIILPIHLWLVYKRGWFMWGDQYVPGLHLPPPANASYRGMTEAKAQAQRVTQSWCTLHWQTISACDRWHFHCVKASETTAARQRAQFQSKSSSFHRKRNSFDIFFFFVRRGYNTSLEYRFKFFWYCMTLHQNTVSSTCWLTPWRRVLPRMYIDLLHGRSMCAAKHCGHMWSLNTSLQKP